MSDTWCLGDGDVHTTVCMPNQDFYMIQQFNGQFTDARQWYPPLKNYGNVNTFVGVGQFNSDNADFSFLYRAYQAGYLQNNTFTFQGVAENEEYAHLTIGGYNKQDFNSEVEWYNMTSNANDW